uniref:Transmembrane protein 150A-like isoform X2 n=1 Tax=Geotrypetes seraphini TaxID=260995 RepID=A0A6P8QJZ0_GEOSA|nr:transmembrane protein 150A-like isoform X2 [Geotrypetes seraphini]
MPAWAILPIVLPVFSIPGMWIVYAMALSNNHICSVTNWAYNQSCELEGPSSCCTTDHVPLVSKCGSLPPESCFFSLICTLGSFLVVLVCLLRYAHVIECCGPSLLNTITLVIGWICAAGLTMLGNFQHAVPVSAVAAHLPYGLCSLAVLEWAHPLSPHVTSFGNINLKCNNLHARQHNPATYGSPLRVDLRYQCSYLLWDFCL